MEGKKKKERRKISVARSIYRCIVVDKKRRRRRREVEVNTCLCSK